MRISKIGATLGAVSLLSGALVLGGAESASAEPCGYFRSGIQAYYNHCAPSDRIVIRVDKRFTDDYNLCVNPGITRLGTWTATQFAYATGQRC
jgi:Family of unknown function (DUF6355)